MTRPIVSSLLLSLLAASSPGCWKSSEGAASEAPGQKNPDKDAAPVLVRLGGFRRASISDTLKVHADLQAVERAAVYSEIGGVVLEVLAREGDFVSKGQAVVRLVDRELQLAADVKKTLWAQSSSKVAEARLATKELEQTLKTKELLAEKARREFERIAGLYSEEAGTASIISKEEFDAKRYAHEEAKINAATTRIQLDKSRVDATLAEQNEAQAELEFRSAEFQLSRTVLRSPIDGAITFLELRPGELVSSSTKAFSVLNPETLEAHLLVPQRELPRLAVGQEVAVRCKVFPERRFSGRVEVINPAVEVDNGMVRVIVGVEDPAAVGFLRPGMFIDGEITVETRENALLASKKAIVFENQQDVVFLVRKGEDLARRWIVERGYSSEGEVEILRLESVTGELFDGVPEEYRLVVQGLNNLKDGSRIEIDEPAATTTPTAAKTPAENPAETPESS